MKLLRMFAILLAASLVASTAPAQGQGKEPSKDQKRAEIRKMCNAALARLYKAKPVLKAHVAKAAGYGRPLRATL